MRRLRTVPGAAVLAAVLGACGGSATGTVIAVRVSHPVRWAIGARLSRPVDAAAGRSDGALVVAAAGRLYVLDRSGHLRPFARAYRSPGGEEPYIAVPAVSHRGCSYGAGAVYAIRLKRGRGVTQVSAAGVVRRFASITAPGLIDGIGFDETGGFGYRLLVTIQHGAHATIVAVSCRGAVTTITAQGPHAEGGVAVAPQTFGRFAGDLILPDENSGRVFAVTPTGKTLLLAASGLPHGGDVGVESAGFLPDAQAGALVADRLTPGNRHPGDDALLELSFGALRAVGVEPGDLLLATEGGAFTDVIHCGRIACTTRYVARGPAVAHLEGHIAFTS